jgi:hypothetical protein
VTIEPCRRVGKDGGRECVRRRAHQFISAFDVTMVGTAPRGAFAPPYDFFATALAFPSFSSASRTFLNSCSVAAFTFG